MTTATSCECPQSPAGLSRASECRVRVRVLVLQGGVSAVPEPDPSSLKHPPVWLLVSAETTGVSWEEDV